MNPSPSKTVVEFRKAFKHFPGSPRPVLDEMDLKIQAESIHVLIGYSGAGKSVTLKHILGLLRVDRGEVLINGVDISKLGTLDLRDFRKRYGMLFQSCALFDSLTVFDNIAFPLREHRKEMNESQIFERVNVLLEQVGLKEAIDKMPSELSGGMQKRVALARSIALDPQILLFDEPTTGLDPVTSQLIDDLIVSTTRRLKATSIIISHDIVAALRMADAVSMIGQGKILETDAPKELLISQNEMVSKFLRSAGVRAD